VAFLAIVAGIVGWLSLTSPEAVTANEEPATVAAHAPGPAGETHGTAGNHDAADAHGAANTYGATETHPAESPGAPVNEHAPAPPAGAAAPAAAEPAGDPHAAAPHGDSAAAEPEAEPEKPVVVSPAVEVPPPPDPEVVIAKEPAADATGHAPEKPKAAAAADAPRPAAPHKPVEIAKLPPVRKDAQFRLAPDPDLVQETSSGSLPQRSSEGRAPWRVYAKPFDTADKRPRVAIVVTGLGLSAAATESAIQGLPGAVTLAFAPYTTDLNRWISLARAAGHEVLLNVPMEPINYPAYDPGPQTLLTSLNEQGNLDRLFWNLSRGTGYVGVIDFMGSRFTMSRPHLAPVLAALRDRGLLYLDSSSAGRSVVARAAPDIRVPWAAATVVLDERASRVGIDSRFGALEREAKRAGRAIGIASPYPVSLERIAAWTRQLRARGIAIAPVSAMVQTDGAPGGAR
ncbi:MAG: divergent polysaccharide deacetylase family protein, partial [Alphaproteobacteria bacterium]